MPKVGVNEPCPCESGLKYKKCCKNVREGIEPPTWLEQLVVDAIINKINGLDGVDDNEKLQNLKMKAEKVKNKNT